MRNSLTLFFVLLGLMLAGGAAAQTNEKAPRDYKLYPYLFVGVQGGATRTFTHPDVSRKWAPMGALSVGAYVTPFLGARVQADGWTWDEDVRLGQGTYSNKWLGGSADLLVNLTGIVLPHRNNLLNVVALAGYGLQYARFGQTPTSHAYPLSQRGNRWMHVWRLGGQLDVNVAKHFSVALEGGYDHVHDHIHGFKVEKWWPYAMVGLNYKFGHKKDRSVMPQTVAVVAETLDDQAALAAAAQPVLEEQKPKPVVEEKKPEPQPVAKPASETQTENVFFRIGRSAVGPQQAVVVQRIAQWAKQHPEATISLTGYADRGTGSARVNQAVSERRVAAVKDALVKQGIDGQRISTQAKGDTEQPFSQNDQNRVVVAVSEQR